MTSSSSVGSVRRRLDAMTDYDKRLRERWLAEWAYDLDPGVTVLDVGAGDAELASLFRRQRYLALDIDPELSPLFVTTIIEDVLRLPLKDEVVGHVLCIQVLEHVTDLRGALSEMARVLRPGGSICLSIPQSDPEHEQPRDYFWFTSFSLKILLGKAGLESIVVRKKGRYFRRLLAEVRDLPTFHRSPHPVVVGFIGQVGSYTTGYFRIARKQA